MDNLDMNQLMQMLSKMDKNTLEAGLKKASSVLSPQDKENLVKKINEINNKE